MTFLEFEMPQGSKIWIRPEAIQQITEARDPRDASLIVGCSSLVLSAGITIVKGAPAQVMARIKEAEIRRVN